MTNDQNGENSTQHSSDVAIGPVERIRSKLKLIGGVLASMAAVGAIIGGLSGYWSAWKIIKKDLLTSAAPASFPPKPVATGVKGGPSIAVFPFENRTGDVSLDSTADDLTRGMIAGLGKFGALHVLGRGATVAFKGRSSEADVLARELKADYTVVGEVRKHGEQTRVIIEISDSRTVAQLWTKTFVSNPEVIDEIVGVAGAMIGSYQGAIGSAEYRRIQAKPATELSPYECIVHITIATYLFASNLVDKGRECVDALTKNDPNNATAWRAYSSYYLYERDFGRPLADAKAEGDRRSALSAQSLTAALRSVDLAPDDAYTHVGLALAYWGNCQGELLSRETKTAIALNPNDVTAFASLGWRHVSVGMLDVGAAMTGRAISLTAPTTPATFWWGWGCAISLAENTISRLMTFGAPMSNSSASVIHYLPRLSRSLAGWMRQKQRSQSL